MAQLDVVLKASTAPPQSAVLARRLPRPLQVPGAHPGPAGNLHLSTSPLSSELTTNIASQGCICHIRAQGRISAHIPTCLQHECYDDMQEEASHVYRRQERTSSSGGLRQYVWHSALVSSQMRRCL